jgi:hypothetical protein
MKMMKIPHLAKPLLAVALGLALGAGAALAMAEPPRAGYAPDPAPQATTKQWVIDISYVRRKLTIDRVKPATSDKPLATPRVMGRYALELYVGKELLDRVRFNVPLLGEGPPERADRPRNPFRRPRFDDVSARLRVQMAENPRATHAVLVDRATGEEQRFEWPPEPSGRLVPKRGAGPAPAGSTTTGPDAGPPKADAGPAPSEKKPESPAPAGSADSGPPAPRPSSSGQRG